VDFVNVPRIPQIVVPEQALVITSVAKHTAGKEAFTHIPGYSI